MTLSGSPAGATTLDQVVRCHDEAVGGDVLRAIDVVEYDLTIAEPGFRVTARYRAQRPDRMRIDIYQDDSRVFSEWLVDGEGWQLPGGATEPQPASPDGTAALLHGLQQPGHFWTLADMEDQGHELELLDSEMIDGVEYHVIELTLSDGFQNWYWVNSETCLIDRSRNFRAFHPDLDPERVWTETVYDRFRVVDGVTRAMRARTINLGTGDVLATTTVEDVRVSTVR